MRLSLLTLILTILVCVQVGTTSADGNAKNKQEGWFSRLYATDTKLLATLPQKGIRYHLWINDIDQGVSQYGQVLELKFGDVLRMSDKHFRCVLRARSSPEFVGLVGSCDGDARGEKVSRTVVLAAESAAQKRDGR